MRKLAKIVTVKEILPIEGADRISIAKMEENGWQCVVKKDEFKPGDKGVYFEIDSLLPVIPAFSFLSDSSIKELEDGSRGYLVKTIKLKKQLSQGLLLPVSAFEYLTGDEDDVTELLNVKLYEKPVPAQLRGLCKGNFPSFIPKTDQERIQNIPEILEEFDSDEWEITTKLDGSSCTMYLNAGEFGVCSRNIDLTETADNTYWQMARKYGIEEILREVGSNIALQGEVCGPGIQKNRLKLPEVRFYLFDIFDISEQRYLLPKERQDFCLSHPQILHVPVKNYSRFLSPTLEDMLNLADGISLNNATQEGIVFKRHSYSGEIRSFKVINNNYLLKHGE